MITIRGHYDGRVIVPDEPVDLPTNSPLVLHVDSSPDHPIQKEESVLEWLERQAVDDPTLPTDMAHQHDHYLYGTPKREG